MGSEKPEDRVRGVCVIGGLNIDIKGISSARFRQGDSNPGRVFRTPGGVAGNIARTLALLGVPTVLLSVVGDDQDGAMIIEAVKRSGVDTRGCEIIPGSRTGTYLSVSDSGGNLFAAVSDMDIMDKADARWIGNRTAQLGEASIIVADANLTGESLSFLRTFTLEHRIPLIVNPVSTTKGQKFLDPSTGADWLLANEEEFLRLTGRPGFSHRFPGIIMTRGKEGAVLIREEIASALPSCPAEAVDPNGAGDAFTAGFVYGIWRGESPEEAARWGAAAGAAAVESEESINPDLGPALLQKIRNRENGEQGNNKENTQ